MWAAQPPGFPTARARSPPEGPRASHEKDASAPQQNRAASPLQIRLPAPPATPEELRKVPTDRNAVPEPAPREHAPAAPGVT